MSKDITLVVLAAGMGSRFGGLKQIEPIGPGGEAILDFSVYDAIKAGFTKVVFVIKHEIEKDFKEIVGKRIEKQPIKVEYAFQELNDLPEGYSVPEGRVKPWGTAHALLAARNVVKEPFGVVNADDFYGADAFVKAAEFLTAEPGCPCKEHYGMIGYPLKNTLSDHGDVNRGICGIQNGYLDSVEEYTKIKTEEDGVCRGDSLSGERKPVDPEELVSMNFWVFPASFIGQIQDHFNRFLAAHGSELKSECYIPTVVDELIHNGKADCSVIKTRPTGSA